MTSDSMNSPLARIMGSLAAALWIAMVACASSSEPGTGGQPLPQATPTAVVEPEEPEQPEQEVNAMQADDAIWLRDDRTAVFPASSFGAYSTPSREAAEAALATAAGTDELAQAQDHTKFVYGIQEPAGTEAVQIFFVCDQPALTTAEQALELLEDAFEVDGGGDCYANATFALDGTLLRISSSGGGA